MSAPGTDLPAVRPAAAPGGAWSARALRGLAAAEIRKTLSTSVWWAMLIPAGLVSMVIAMITATDGRLGHSQAFALGSFGVVFALLFGTVSASAEYRHHTIATSYLVTADRARLTVAKMAVAAVVGAGYALVTSALGIAGMLVRGAHPFAELGSVLQVSAVAVVVFALWAVLGVGFGTLVSSQVLAVVGVLLYLLIVEPILQVLAAVADLDRLGPYLPGPAAATSLEALTGEQFGGGFGVGPPWWLMLLVFFGYTVLVGLVGTATAHRRDIT